MNPQSTKQTTGFDTWLREQGPLAALLALCFLAAVASPLTFVTPVNLANILRQVSLIGLVSVGMALVIVSGGIDLSVGSTAAVASILAAQWTDRLGLAVAPMVLLVGVLIGAVNGLLIIRIKIPPFIATLSVMLAARGLAFALCDGKPVTLEESSWLWPVAKTDVLGVPFVGILFLLTLGVAILVVGYTRFGRSLLAIGGGEEAARMMGLNVSLSKMLVYMVSGGCAAMAGMLLASRLSSGDPTVTEGWELAAIAAVVLGGISLGGGIGKVGHVLYGVLILGVIPNMINSLQGTLTSLDKNIITGILLLAAVLLQSRAANHETTVGDAK